MRVGKNTGVMKKAPRAMVTLSCMDEGGTWIGMLDNTKDIVTVIEASTKEKVVRPK